MQILISILIISVVVSGLFIVTLTILAERKVMASTQTILGSNIVIGYSFLPYFISKSQVILNIIVNVKNKIGVYFHGLDDILKKCVRSFLFLIHNPSEFKYFILNLISIFLLLLLAIPIIIIYIFLVLFCLILVSVSVYSIKLDNGWKIFYSSVDIFTILFFFILGFIPKKMTYKKSKMYIKTRYHGHGIKSKRVCLGYKMVSYKICPNFYNILFVIAKLNQRIFIFYKIKIVEFLNNPIYFISCFLMFSSMVLMSIIVIYNSIILWDGMIFANVGSNNDGEPGSSDQSGDNNQPGSPGGGKKNDFTPHIDKGKGRAESEDEQEVLPSIEKSDSYIKSDSDKIPYSEKGKQRAITSPSPYNNTYQTVGIDIDIAKCYNCKAAIIDMANLGKGTVMLHSNCGHLEVTGKDCHNCVSYPTAASISSTDSNSSEFSNSKLTDEALAKLDAEEMAKMEAEENSKAENTVSKILADYKENLDKLDKSRDLSEYSTRKDAHESSNRWADSYGKNKIEPESSKRKLDDSFNEDAMIARNKKIIEDSMIKTHKQDTKYSTDNSDLDRSKYEAPVPNAFDYETDNSEKN